MIRLGYVRACCCGVLAFTLVVPGYVGLFGSIAIGAALWMIGSPLYGHGKIDVCVTIRIAETSRFATAHR